LVSNSELFVQAIELWQEIDLDLNPCDQPDDSGIRLSLGLKPVIGESNIAETETTVNHPTRRLVAIFSINSLNELKPLTEELNAVLSVESSSVLLQIELDDFEISAEEFDSIESGALVLLPKSYQSEWVIEAKSITPELQFQVSGALIEGKDSTEIRLSVLDKLTDPVVNTVGNNNSNLTDAFPSSCKVSVHCQNLCEVPIKQLIGSSKNIQIPVDTSQLILTSANRAVAHGALLAYGDGGVFAVSQMAEPG